MNDNLGKSVNFNVYKKLKFASSMFMIDILSREAIADHTTIRLKPVDEHVESPNPFGKLYRCFRPEAQKSYETSVMRDEKNTSKAPLSDETKTMAKKTQKQTKNAKVMATGPQLSTIAEESLAVEQALVPSNVVTGLQTSQNLTGMTRAQLQGFELPSTLFSAIPDHLIITTTTSNTTMAITTVNSNYSRSWYATSTAEQAESLAPSVPSNRNINPRSVPTTNAQRSISNDVIDINLPLLRSFNINQSNSSSYGSNRDQPVSTDSVWDWVNADNNRQRLTMHRPEEMRNIMLSSNYTGLNYENYYDNIERQQVMENQWRQPTMTNNNIELQNDPALLSFNSNIRSSNRPLSPDTFYAMTGHNNYDYNSASGGTVDNGNIWSNIYGENNNSIDEWNVTYDGNGTTTGSINQSMNTHTGGNLGSTGTYNNNSVNNNFQPVNSGNLSNNANIWSNNDGNTINDMSVNQVSDGHVNDPLNTFLQKQCQEDPFELLHHRFQRQQYNRTLQERRAQYEQQRLQESQYQLQEPANQLRQPQQLEIIRPQQRQIVFQQQVVNMPIMPTVMPIYREMAPTIPINTRQPFNSRMTPLLELPWNGGWMPRGPQPPQNQHNQTDNFPGPR